MLKWAKALYDEGFTLLLFDFRGYGESGGRRCTASHEERHDLLGALDFVETHDARSSDSFA